MVETMIADRIEECLVERKGENHYLPELPHWLPGFETEMQDRPMPENKLPGNHQLDDFESRTWAPRARVFGYVFVVQIGFLSAAAITDVLLIDNHPPFLTTWTGSWNSLVFYFAFILSLVYDSWL